ncbi:MAG: tRNA (adenosine(37)-N6)-threonylcarbamoyltransferase complex ATPase subunit type 1 TsaE [Bacteroidales bacterium]|jgi:tRNA threonylcarbamoyladenosine biosynthesis protein TsaE|nr:tRNA (adenosine(37)-N6)-threonylcarbamoyltransferase complex ATPase subunit type 1 TsaE [Bacteroidales bacterium]
MIKLFENISKKELTIVAEYISELSDKHNVFAFYGDMGAGKTTLIAEIVKKIIGENFSVTSPTFSLVNVYNGKKTIYHFDCYRIENTAEALDAGIEDLIYGKNICLIEWSEKIEDILPKNVVIINIKSGKDDFCRNIEVILQKNE